jgi:hypothetical protein
MVQMADPKTDTTTELLVPPDVIGMRLCKVVGKGDHQRLRITELIMFDKGAPAVDTVLRRAQISGPVGPVGETGDYWADLYVSENSWTETIALSAGAWKALKNRWMRCAYDDVG